MRKRYVGVLIYTIHNHRHATVKTLFIEAIDEDAAREEFLKIRPHNSYLESLLINEAPPWWQKFFKEKDQE